VSAFSSLILRHINLRGAKKQRYTGIHGLPIN
jgi:hypothetical protein